MLLLDQLPHPRPHRVEADTDACGGVQEEQFALKIVDGDALGYLHLGGHRQDAFHHASQVIDAPSSCQESWILLSGLQQSADCATMSPVSFWHDIPQPIVGLSPMDGVTDPAFRYIVARYGKPDVQVTEFVSVDEVCHGGDSAWCQLRYAEIQRPVWAHIYGADPDTLYH